MDFEAKYQAGAARPFDQKNEMFKRVWWDKKFEEDLRSFQQPIAANGRNGATNENLALRNAAWSIERAYARGNYHGQYGMFSWDNENVIPGMAAIDPATPFDASDPARNSRIVKRAARFFGAALTGICKLDRRWIYTNGFRLPSCEVFDIDVADEYAYVINVAIEMDYDQYRLLPTYLGSAETGFGYSKMAITAGLLAQFLRHLGVKAIPSGNDTAMSIPYAIQAGLGELGRNGLLITRPYGPRVRLCKIFTNLPLQCDEPGEFGVKEFCDVCRQCAAQCPGRAIAQGERTAEGCNISNAPGPLKWYVDGEKCYSFWTRSRCECGACIRVCPFNKPKGRLHDAARGVIERFPKLDRLLLKADRWLRYDRPRPIGAYWEQP